MKIANKLATLGVAALSTGLASAAIIPATTHAATMPTARKAKPLTLMQDGNKAVTVNTELDCQRHTLTAKVTNKLKTNITPEVTFNGDEPNVPGNLPIEPGKTGNYFYDYSGNNLLAEVEVDVDGYAPVKLSPTLYCSEPVSFQVTAASKSAVTGILTNNSSMVAQTVLTRVNGGDIRTESLEPGESRLIAMPFTSFPGANNAYVSIGTTTGYEGDYNVATDQPTMPPMPIAPLPKK